MRTLPVLALFAASAIGLSAATLTLSDFSNFTPDYTGGSWNEDTFQSDTTSFTIGNFIAQPVSNGSLGVTFAAVDWTGYINVSLTGLAAGGSAANETEFLNFFVMDENFNTAVAQFTLADFGTGPSAVTGSAVLDLSGVDATHITDWGFGTGNGSDNFAFTFDKVTVSTSVVPEPSTYAAIFGAVALTGAAIRRYRRRV